MDSSSIIGDACGPGSRYVAYELVLLLSGVVPDSKKREEGTSKNFHTCTKIAAIIDWNVIEYVCTPYNPFFALHTDSLVQTLRGAHSERIGGVRNFEPVPPLTISTYSKNKRTPTCSILDTNHTSLCTTQDGVTHPAV